MRILLLLFFILSFTAGPSHIFITFTPILFAGCFKKLIDYRFIWHSVIVIVFPSEKHITSKGKSDILEILILRFDFSYFDVKLLQDDVTYTNCTAFIFIIGFLYYESLIISRIEIKQNLVCYFKSDFTVCQSLIGCFENPDLSIRVVYCWGEA